MSATPPPPSAPTRFDGFVPNRAGIDAYGNGGFRFSGMSHRGSLLVLADGMHAWTLPPAINADDLTEPLLAVLARLEVPQFLLVGTGRTHLFPTPALRQAFMARGIGLDTMDTGAACRTFNVLLAEQRSVTAALIAVD